MLQNTDLDTAVVDWVRPDGTVPVQKSETDGLGGSYRDDFPMPTVVDAPFSPVYPDLNMAVNPQLNNSKMILGVSPVSDSLPTMATSPIIYAPSAENPLPVLGGEALPSNIPLSDKKDEKIYWWLGLGLLVLAACYWAYKKLKNKK